MKKITLLLSIFALSCLLPVAGAAQHVGIIDHTRGATSISGLYTYTSSQYDLESSVEADSELVNQVSALRLTIPVNEYLGFYGVGGSEFLKFADEELENDGMVYGGGAEITVNPAEDVVLKLTGSFLEHDVQEFENNSDELEITKDWQVGVLLAREVREVSQLSPEEEFLTYAGATFTDREFEIDSGGTIEEFELDEMGGASLVAGFTYVYTSDLNFELEGQAGALNSATGQLNYYF